MLAELNQEDKSKIIIEMRQESKPDKYFYTMVILSCIIATYGLLSDSVAVIIGAMLIAPLMFPILNGALSLTLGSNKLLKTALIAEFSGIIISILCAMTLTLLLPVSDITPEIIARTKPTLLDLVIAIASGMAGTVAICYRPSSAILPGVAIASALMPPLCVIGIGIAKHDFNIATGATLLFLSNIIAINVAGIIVFELVGFGSRINDAFGRTLTKEIFFKKFVSPFILLIIITIPLIYFMHRSYSNTNIQTQINTKLKEGITLIDPVNEVVSTSFKNINNKIIVNTTIRSIEPLTPTFVRQLENKLEYEIGMPVEITTEIVPIVKVTAKETTQNKHLLTKTTKQESEELISIEDIVENAINEKLSLIPDAKLLNYSFNYNSTSSTYEINANIITEKKPDPNLKNAIQLGLEKKLNRKVHLNFNSASSDK